MYNANKEEQEILKYWEEHKCFEKSVESRSVSKPYVFYDGPPFATGLPHYGHILGSVIKDVVPRYQTMKGWRVRRRWGWDCHGLPIENIVEKELKISGKKDIEEKLGVEKFNEICRSKVLTYTHDWKKMIDRIGRWVEFDNAYKTMDSTYMESVWWALKTIWDKGLIYNGRKVLMYCPRCETPVSKAEIAMDNSYKDIIEEAVTVKFKVKNPTKHGLSENTYLLAWTTTPWTLPGNVALAVGEKIEYLLVKSGAENYILAKDRVTNVLSEKYEVFKELSGADLIGLEYEPLFDIPAVKNSGKNAWYVASADFVTTEEGTGIVHTAVIYGEDDYNLGVKLDLPMVPLLDEKGHFNEDAPELIRGQYFKKAEKAIKEDLEKRGLLFTKEKYTHSYPHCWRCDTQLFYNAISAWFIDIQKIKSRLIELNEKINWYPEHLKHGRFLNILETAPDWNISRNRYWATPLPFWKCECGQTKCIGSVKELKAQAINFDAVYNTEKVEDLDLHKDQMDKIKLKCACGKEMARIPEVIDCWMESAAMPFAEWHYPFENKKVFKSRFPGQYIAEYIAQTRAWFYYMHVVSALLFDDVSFENCVTTGTILNAKGEKLSKSKLNYTDPWVIIEQYGVDAMRYYMMNSVVMDAENLFFSDKEVKEIYNKVINILWNVVEFYKMYAEKDGAVSGKQLSDNILDKWILAKLNLLIKEITEQMDNYNTVKASRSIKDFIDDLSTWYLRRSRDRFKGDDEADKQAALVTLREVLMTLSKLMAPFTPFIVEKIYLALGGEKESVHLEDWPKADEKLIDEKLLAEMTTARKIVEMGLALRAAKCVKVRQPLPRLLVAGGELSEAMRQIVADELNVKKVEINKKGSELKVELDVEITQELKKEGLAREIIRAINQKRKEIGLTIHDQVIIKYQTDDKLLREVFTEFSEEIKKSVLAKKLEEGEGEKIEIDGVSVEIKIEKI
ncbi:MAG: isoleucine--tRNA ligase [Candidatus Magasanikbacteria bacterium]|nr:isoleucine--tRNA ligase [Candidatus Magasanikbacteria bacterium]